MLRGLICGWNQEPAKPGFPLLCSQRLAWGGVFSPPLSPGFFLSRIQSCAKEAVWQDPNHNPRWRLCEAVQCLLTEQRRTQGNDRAGGARRRVPVNAFVAVASLYGLGGQVICRPSELPGEAGGSRAPAWLPPGSHVHASHASLQHTASHHWVLEGCTPSGRNMHNGRSSLLWSLTRGLPSQSLPTPTRSGCPPSIPCAGPFSL